MDLKKKKLELRLKQKKWNESGFYWMGWRRGGGDYLCPQQESVWSLACCNKVWDHTTVNKDSDLDLLWGESGPSLGIGNC